MTMLSKVDYQKLHAHLGRLLPPGGRPLNAEEVVDVGELREKLARCAAEVATAVERGRKVLEWRIPNMQCPTMNAYAFMKTWQRVRLRQELDAQLVRIIDRTPEAKIHGTSKQRWARVTRFTTVPESVDDNAIDAIGGKMPVDALVRCGVLNGDTPALLHREGLVRKTNRGNTHLLVEIFEVASEEVPDPGPVDGPVEQVVRKCKKFTAAIVGEENATVKPKRRARAKKATAGTLLPGRVWT